MRKTLLFIPAALTAIQALAGDFPYEYRGQTLWYTVTDEDARTCMVTCRDGYLSGELEIPAVAMDGETGYSVTSIGENAFMEMHGLESVTIPASVTGIDGNIFVGCSNLTDISVDPSNPAYTSADGVLFSRDMDRLISCPSERYTAYTVPETVTAIGEYAFSCNRGLSSVTIPESVTAIGNGAFSGCLSLEKITVPESVTSISEYTFEGCGNLVSVSLPQSLRYIGDSAFSACLSLVSVSIPERVEYVGDRAFVCCGIHSIEIPASVTFLGNEVFFDCGSLTEINVHPDNRHYASTDGVLFDKDIKRLLQYPARKHNTDRTYTIPETVTAIGSRAFMYADGTIIFPGSLESIGYLAFGSCQGLASLDLPDSLTSIEDYAFSGCYNLTSVTIPESVTHLGRGVWSNCDRICEVRYLTDGPIAADPDLFSSEAYRNSTLYVTGSPSTIRQTEPWSLFRRIEDLSGIETVADGTPGAMTGVYDMKGIYVSDSTEGIPAGIYLVRQGVKTAIRVVR